jgi:hypothetical protein
MLHENYEDGETCKAFAQMFDTIKSFQKIENSAKYQNVSALEKCKEEIENLLYPNQDK